ncbi:hypothetical protein TI03_06235 [Achromatium sp. WMS1]|nr:hypothetical protein TI03_06235 [Achromatium sp. WMS1]
MGQCINNKGTHCVPYLAGYDTNLPFLLRTQSHDAKVVVVVALTNEQVKEVALLRRALDLRQGGELLFLSGKVIKDDLPTNKEEKVNWTWESIGKKAAIRELNEELGIKVPLENITVKHGIFHQDSVDGIKLHFILCAAKLPEKTDSNFPERNFSISSVEWQSMEELNRLQPSPDEVFDKMREWLNPPTKTT